MATDPTKSIQEREFSTPFDMSARELLDRLAHLQPSLNVPYLTVSVDWRVEGTSPGREEPEEVKRSQDRSGTQEGDRWRPAIEVIERELDDLIEQHGPRGEVFDSLSEDKRKIHEYLVNDLDPAAQGAFLVSCSAQGVFEASGFALPLENKVECGPTPVLYSLVQMVEDYPTYAVLLADQREAVLTFITSGRAEREVAFQGSEFPRHQQQGGWSQRRYQMRAEERIEAFAGDVAEETRVALDELGVQSLIVAGNEVVTSTLDHEFHETVKSRIIDTIHLDIRTDLSELIDATFPIAERAERSREAAKADTVQDLVGADARGAAGAEDTLLALQARQVDELLLVDTFEGTGWADYEMDVFGVGERPSEHPTGGNLSSLVDIDLRNEMIRLALATGATVEIVHSDVPVTEDEDVPDAGEGRPVTAAAKALNELGGVAARLRFTLDETPLPQGV
jgi:hypothetical protein